MWTFNSIKTTIMKSQVCRVISPQITKCLNQNKSQNGKELLCPDTLASHRISHLDPKGTRRGAEGGRKGGKIKIDTIHCRLVGVVQRGPVQPSCPIPGGPHKGSCLHCPRSWKRLGACAPTRISACLCYSLKAQPGPRLRFRT